ncbi:MAG TPA: hypothetical protein VGZ73_12145 [Bryobacteraceae bacterium]|jgi:hypothetical protein|nr:hypothetical protein [Bryobacteraceae bacterium]
MRQSPQWSAIPARARPVAGLVQINAIMPLAAKAGASDSLTVSIGNAT